MKKILVLVLCLAVFSCSQKKEAANEQQSEEKVQKAFVGNYGEQITAEGAISVEELVSQLEGKDSVTAKVMGEIIVTCEKKGCWMNVVAGNGEEMRVTFKDYGFFVPTEGMEGKQVIMEGTAKREMVAVDMLKHFAEDAGKSQTEIDAITEPEEKLNFVATGVIIKDKGEKSL